MSVINNGLLLASAADAAVGYQISRSLRFNSSDSAYLSRVFTSTGNRRIWTFAAWIKRSSGHAEQAIFSGGTGGNDSTFGQIIFATNDSIRINGYTSTWRETSQVFRDYSAWYHIVVAFDTTQATASNRVKLYVNGAEVTQFAQSSNPSLNTDYGINQADTHQLGKTTIGSSYFSGYLADIHFIDGQALTPSSFGEYDTNNVWQPKAYSGSYGTNGFRLPLSDNSGTTSTTLGKDSAGSNNWTPNNFSVASGSGNDSLVDSPTNYGTDTGVGGEVRGNYCTLNPLDSAQTPTNGNLDVSMGANFNKATFAMPSGKWYWEITVTSSGETMIGIAPANKTSKPGGGATFAAGAPGFGYYNQQGNFYNGSGGVSYGATYGNGDVIGVAFDADANSITFYKNGASQGQKTGLTADLYMPAVSGGGSTGSSVVCNFGQRPFAYTAPSGFKALCTANLPTPTIAKGSDYFDVKLYTGNGSTQTISGLNFSPDWVWIKGRSGATDHALYDIVRGVQKDLVSNNTAAETTQTTGLTAFNSGGFDLGSLAKLNTSSATYAAWCWDAGSSTVSNTQGSITSTVRANASAGFSVVTYNATGSGGATIGHGLNVAPSFIISKQRSFVAGGTNWQCYHASIGNTSSITLNTTGTPNSDIGWWNNTSPTSTVYSVGTYNRNGGDYVAYCFTPVAGYSSFGSYTGNGSTDGPFVYTGFRPRWILLKDTTNTASWELIDTARIGYNGANYRLFPNLSDAEFADHRVDILCNGFKLRTGAGTAVNSSNAVIIYAAFAESPFAYARAR